MDYLERLRCLAQNNAAIAADAVEGVDVGSPGVDAKTLALVRLAALVAVDAAVPSYSAHVDAAVGAGATAAELVDVLVGIVPVVGLPCVVAAAPRLALALGYDTEDDEVLDHPRPGRDERRTG